MKTGNKSAIDSFVAKKAAIDAMLDRLIAFSDDHFDLNPEQIDWGHVGSISNIEDQLRKVCDAAFNEGEFA